MDNLLLVLHSLGMQQETPMPHSGLTAQALWLQREDIQGALRDSE